MRKKVLALCYSQSGQTCRLAEALLRPLADHPHVEVILSEIKAHPPFPFPWPIWRFFDAMPESVLLDTRGTDVTIVPPPGSGPFDLVILSYQVWFLAPSIPFSALLRSPYASLFYGAPVVTVVNARDKWVTAHRKISELVAGAGGHLIGHIAVVPAGDPLEGLVTTLRWLWFGKKEGFWRFREAGLKDAEIDAVQRFGHVLLRALETNTLGQVSTVFEEMGAAPIDEHLLKQERVGHGIFLWWARKIRGNGRRGLRRTVLLTLFVIQLGILIGISVPVSLAVGLVRHLKSRARAGDEGGGP